MSDYTETIDVQAPAKTVFGFVSDVKNLPLYLPTVHQASRADAGHVAVEGEANGHPYHSEGWFKSDEGGMRLSWGSEGANDYSGELRVTASGDAARVACTLHFNPKPDTAAQMEHHQGGRDAAIREGLRASLTSIKQLCEGTGGKQPSSADRVDPPL
ncbi:MAG: SRPBCC family protein [Acidisphaera sp.]|nr:SRPBCC family protein [Acidisphaera sp.]